MKLWEIIKVRPSWEEVAPNEFGHKGWIEAEPYYINILGEDIVVSRRQANTVLNKVMDFKGSVS